MIRRLFAWRVIILLVFALLFAFYIAISVFVVRGVAIVDRSEPELKPENYNLPVKDVEFLSRNDNLNLKGWYVSEPDREHAVIFVHGFGGNRSSGSALDIGSAIWNNGFNVLLFDLRASGISEGDMASGGYFEQDDVLGAFDFVHNTGIPHGNIGVVGFSMGAATGILSASREPGIKAVVSDGTYANILDLIEQEVALATPMPTWMVPFFKPGITVIASLVYGIKLDEIVPEKAVSDINYPILLIHGTEDTRISPEHSIRVHSAARTGSILWEVEGAGHVGSFQKATNEYIARIIRYFRARFDLPIGTIIGP